MQENKAVQSRLNFAVPRLFAVMLLMTFISCHVISGTVAKYSRTGTEGSDSARVASFSVTAADGESSLTVSYPSPASYTINVRNDSEVAVSYTIEVSFDDDVSSMLSVALDGDTKTGTVSGGKTTYTWSSNAFALNAGNADGEKSLALSVTPQASVLPGESSKVESDSNSYSFHVEVTFEQID